MTRFHVRRDKAALFQRVQAPPGEPLQPEATGAGMEATKCLKPSDNGRRIRDRYPRASDISSPPCLPRLLPAGAIRRAGLAPAGKAPPCHGARGQRPFLI